MSRIPFVAAVVGALLIGGATTGGTHATWVNAQSLAASTAKSGSMDFTLGAPSTLAAINAGSEGQTTFVVTDTGVGKKLVQRITATVASTPAGVSAFVATGSTCGGSTAPAAFADKTPSDASRTQTYCVRVMSTATAVSGNVTLSVTGAQRPSGWSVAAKTVTIPVTITQPAPPAPALVCSGTSSDPNARTFTWTSVGSGATYQVYRQAPGATTFTPLTPTQSATTFTETNLGANLTSLFKVKSILNGVESIFSSTVTISRNGNSANYNCSVAP
jgi:hypothetical protein